MTKRSERGTAAVEFAIVLPILLIIILSLIDFGRYFYVRISLSNTTIEVANSVSRGLILATDSPQVMTAKITNIISTISPDIANFAQLSSSAQLDMNPLPTACPNSVNQTTVTLSTPLQSISPLKIFFSSASSSSTLRCLR